MMQTTTLLVRAAMSNIVDDLRESTDTDNPLHVVAEAMDNVDWGYFDSMSDTELCAHAGHDFNNSSDGECYICGEPR